MNELAAAHPRYGYRRIWALLRGAGFRVNRKRIERLWRAEGHRVPPRRSQASGRKAQGAAANAPWNLAASKPNQIRSYDFMAARTRSGASLRILNVVDEYTRLALSSRVDRSLGAAEVIAELERLFARHTRSATSTTLTGRRRERTNSSMGGKDTPACGSLPKRLSPK
jgi:putative transposase